MGSLSCRARARPHIGETHLSVRDLRLISKMRSARIPQGPKAGGRARYNVTKKLEEALNGYASPPWC
jgi:hypothetical protein